MIARRIHTIFFWGLILFCFLLSLAVQQGFGLAGRPGGNLVINEVVAANASGLQDEDGDYSDWIEIYNPNARAVSLAGWSLTDDPGQPDKWRFPEMTLPGRDYLLVFASGKNRVDLPGELHTNFRLSQAGEFLALYNIVTNQLFPVQPAQLPAQFRDVSYGLYGSAGAYGYFTTLTPGGPNGNNPTWVGQVAGVHFSVARGFYDTPFTVALSTTTPEATIFYTTDGSEPTPGQGLVYTGPITVERTAALRAAAFKPELRPSQVGTHTYIFLEDVLNQPADPPNFPPTWGIYSRDRRGYSQGEPVIADYEMDPEIVDNPRYRDRLLVGLKVIPSLSIVTDIANYDIYAHPLEHGRNWERPVSVELIDPEKEREGFQIDAGLRIQGNVGRQEFVFKHPFRLFFRGVYGEPWLNHPLFPDSPVEIFDTLVLRSGVNRSYAGYIDEDHIEDLRLTTYTRDEWLRASQIAMSGVGSHGTFVHLYLNGVYWGLYNLVERPDAAFASTYFGGEEAAWGVVNQDGPVSGSVDRFEILHQLARAGGLENPEKYAKIQEYLDVNQFIDYVILNWYAGNVDWGHNNWYAAFRNPGGKINYFAWDNEVIWLEGAKTRLGEVNAAGEPNRIKVLFRALAVNPDFRMALIDRMYKHLFNDGALTEAKAQARWIRLNEPIAEAIVAESARWGDARYADPITPDDWQMAYEDVLAQMRGNVAKLVGLRLDNAGFYPDFNPPTFNQRGGLVPAGFEVTLTPTKGTIHYTTDGSDPRMAVTGEAAPTAMVYDGPIVLTSTTPIRVRSRLDETWSALDEVTFKVVEGDPELRITEIMYNPPGGGDYEFIELKNVGDGPFALAQMAFEGIMFTFPPSTPPLAPGEIVVLARNPTAFVRRYPAIPLHGGYRGQLSNKGETIHLKNQDGEVVLSVSYDDENGWPLSPDGRGDSLVLVNPSGDSNNPANWRASQDRYGSPGQDEPGQ